jgi:hypothetical protein
MNDAKWTSTLLTIPVIVVDFFLQKKLEVIVLPKTLSYLSVATFSG